MPRRLLNLLLLLFALPLTAPFTTPISAAAVPIVLIDGEEHDAAEILSLDNGTLRAKNQAGEEIEFAASRWLRWGHPAPPPARRPRLHVPGCGWLTAWQGWAGRTWKMLKDDELMLLHASLRNTRFPKHQVDLVLLHASKSPELQQRIESEAFSSRPETDRVWLTSGDMLTGTVTRVNGKLTLDIRGEAVELPTTNVAAISIGKSPENTAELKPAQWLLGFEDGTFLRAAELKLDAKTISITTPQGSTWEGLRGRTGCKVCFLQSLSPDIHYLSDLPPVDFKHTPYFEKNWDMKVDANLTGESLSAGGQWFAKGIAMHSAARAVYRIPNGAGRFCSKVGIDDSAGDKGSAVFRVYLVKESGLENVFESPVMRGGQPPQDINVPVNGAQALVLIVDFADFGDELDHCDWLDARLVP